MEGKVMTTAKFWIALLTAALTGIVNVLPVDSTATQWVNFILVVLGAIAVYLVPNKPGPAPAETSYERRPGM
jgi:hypothetical protein